MTISQSEASARKRMSMKIFVAGASGAIGRRLIERLTRDGHKVTGMIRRAEGADRLRQLGAEPVQVDTFDRDAVRAALERAEPAVVIDQLTSLPKSPADLAKALPADRKLRVEGGGNLFAAAEELGVRRYIQQSSGFYLAAQDGLADESAPLRVDGPGGIAASSIMYAELEERVLNSPRLGGIALRYGFFYGPGTWYWTDGAVAEQVRRLEIPVIGSGNAVWSFVHTDDAAAATVAALDAEPGVYNVVDDDPVSVARWLPAFAHWAGAPEPIQLSIEEAIEQVGAEAVYYHTQLTGASNRKAKATLGFNPRPLAWMDRRQA
jgi:2-alkyl-3-oxoalkanoate reductase